MMHATEGRGGGRCHGLPADVLEAVRAAAARLPDPLIDPACLVQRKSTKLTTCGNLAPAGTASSTLRHFLAAVSKRNNRLHHTHTWRAGQALCFDIKPPAFNCACQCWKKDHCR